MIKWLVSKFKKAVPKDVYKVTYIPCCDINDLRGEKVAEFMFSNLREVYIEAHDLLEVQVEFAKKMAIAPHVMVDRIEKVISRS